MASDGSPLVLVHFGAAWLTEALLGHGGGRQANPIDWYCQWASGTAGSVYVLLPESLRPRLAREGFAASYGEPVWYADDGRPDIPPLSPDDGLWVVNGGILPIVNWDAADEAVARHRCDALVFGPPGATSSSQYPESLVVDDTGRVLRVERHYFDSPAFTDVSFGPVSFLYASGPRAEAVLHHVLVHGWDLASMRQLAQFASVEWCAAPGVLSSLAGAGVAAQSATSIRTPAAPWASGDARTPRPLTPPPTSTSPPGSPNAAPAGTAAATSDSLPDFWLDSPFPRRGGAGLAYRFAKRTLDLAASLAGLIVLSPLLAAITVMIRVTSGKPVFYSDRRQGLGGAEFPCLKFRTMIVGAAEQQAQLRNHNEVDGPQFKIADDPRLTQLGRWLRRYNLDELPQLFNVLLGQMSLVGPRPSPDRENQLCPGWRRTRLSVKPGITGLWQVLRLRDAASSDFQEWIYYDVEYARHQSLWLDLQILLYTPLTVFAPHRLAGLARKLARRGISKQSALIHARPEGMAAPARSDGTPGKPKSDAAGN